MYEKSKPYQLQPQTMFDSFKHFWWPQKRTCKLLGCKSETQAYVSKCFLIQCKLTTKNMLLPVSSTSLRYIIVLYHLFIHFGRTSLKPSRGGTYYVNNRLTGTLCVKPIPNSFWTFLGNGAAYSYLINHYLNVYDFYQRPQIVQRVPDYRSMLVHWSQTSLRCLRPTTGNIYRSQARVPRHVKKLKNKRTLVKVSPNLLI